MMRHWPGSGALVIAVAMVASWTSSTAAEEGDTMTLRVASEKVLSERGSTRATRYTVSNKIVTLGGKTHVAWLDSISETMVATYTHDAAKWSEPVGVGTGKDNHGGPALLCDSEGYLHIIFGPHGGPFQYCISARPNDSTEWDRQDEFGVDGTYPSAVFDDRDTLHVIYRGGEGGAKRLVFQSKPKGQPWSELTELAAAPIESGYTHYHSALTIANDLALHVAYDIYYNGAAKCAGHLTSRDRGKTWTLADGSAVDLPVKPNHEAFFRTTDDALKVSSVVCDSEGRPWVSTTGLELWHFDGRQWQVIRPALSAGISQEQASRGLGTIGIDSNDRLYWFGALGGRFFLLYSSDGGRSFKAQHIADPLPEMPLMGPSVERPTGHNSVGVPWLLFSHGQKGPDTYGEGIFHRVTAAQLAWARPGN